MIEDKKDLNAAPSYTVRDIEEFQGPFPADFFFWTNPADANLRMPARLSKTFSYNNGRLAFVDESGNLHLGVLSTRNYNVLTRAGYAPADWGVPGSNGENAEFNEWYAIAREREAYADALERSKTLEVPAISYRGPFSTNPGALPGEFVIGEDGHMITWYCAHLPDNSGGSTSGFLLSPNTPENRQKLIEAGYEQGEWKGINLASDVTADVRKSFDEWLSKLSA